MTPNSAVQPASVRAPGLNAAKGGDNSQLQVDEAQLVGLRQQYGRLLCDLCRRCKSETAAVSSLTFVPRSHRDHHRVPCSKTRPDRQLSPRGATPWLSR